jgi:hypothetical protein
MSDWWAEWHRQTVEAVRRDGVHLHLNTQGQARQVRERTALCGTWRCIKIDLGKVTLREVWLEAPNAPSP